MSAASAQPCPMTAPPHAPAALELRGVTAGYGGTTVLRDIDLALPPGHVLALLGPNGAGKTTLIRAAAGALRVSRGRVLMRERDMTARPPYVRSRAGMCLVPEGRGIFPSLTVRENLYVQTTRQERTEAVQRAVAAFPVLGKRLSQIAGSMSGGEQQMLALARCYVRQPAVVLVDEVSMGLGPKVIDDIYGSLRELAGHGVALVLVEQYVDRALELADSVQVLNRGRTVFRGRPDDLGRTELIERYLGERAPTHSAVEKL
jgi:branched-chain amino acid transport system ATP-binding protein